MYTWKLNETLDFTNYKETNSSTDQTA